MLKTLQETLLTLYSLAQSNTQNSDELKSKHLEEAREYILKLSLSSAEVENLLGNTPLEYFINFFMEHKMYKAIREINKGLSLLIHKKAVEKLQSEVFGNCKKCDTELIVKTVEEGNSFRQILYCEKCQNTFYFDDNYYQDIQFQNPFC